MKTVPSGSQVPSTVTGRPSAFPGYAASGPSTESSGSGDSRGHRAAALSSAVVRATRRTANGRGAPSPPRPPPSADGRPSSAGRAPARQDGRRGRTARAQATQRPTAPVRQDSRPQADLRFLVVEPRGLEPLTPCLQSRCATNCAKAPRAGTLTPYDVRAVRLNHRRRRSALSMRCRVASAHRACSLLALGSSFRLAMSTPTAARAIRSIFFTATPSMGEPVGLTGLEPVTSSLSGKRSNRLSYRPGGGRRRDCGPTTGTAARRPRGKVTAAADGHPKPRPALLNGSARRGQPWSSAKVTSMPPSSEAAML